jgi:hypothetical protein
MGLRNKFLNVVLKDLPTSSSIINQSSPRFDELMGGKKAPGMWERFQTNYGTTCAVTVVGWLLDSNAPSDMLNAAPPGGAGFTPGAHFTKLNAGAKSRGWWKTPVKGQLPDFRPGDIYEINHGNGNNSHVGVVLSVTPSADGQSIAVETADGGQGSTTAQEISRQVRTFSIGHGAHAVEYSAKYSSGWLDGWIALGGDEALDEPAPSTPAPSGDGAGGAPPSDDGAEGGPSASVPRPRASRGAGADSFALALGALGVGLLLSGAAWYARNGRFQPLPW